MVGTANKTDDPCEECRHRHLKCDDNRPKCDNCARNGQKCLRNKGLRKFRDGSSAQYEKQFAKDQVWLGFSKNAKIQIVDQTPELENFYSIEEPEHQSTRPLSSPLSTVGNPITFRQSATSNPVSPSRQSNAHSDFTIRTPIDVNLTSIDSQLPVSPSKRRRLDESPPVNDIKNGLGHFSSVTEEMQKSYVLRDRNSNCTGSAPHYEYGSPTESSNVTRKIEAEFRRLADTEAARIPDEPFLSPSVWKEQFFWPNQYTTTQCECLFSYYIERLGPWFDVGDFQRHFTTVVPARARRCPPLLNAVFAAAALHLRYWHEKKTGSREVYYRNIALPNLNKFATLKYYHAAISYLRVLSANEAHVRDEDLLAATVILRFYEELESAMSTEPGDASSRQFQIMVATQAQPTFQTQIPYEAFSLAGVFASVRREAEDYLKGYRYASFRIALRQECASALTLRQFVDFPLEAWSILDGFDEVSDSIWTDRHLYHYAKVLQFCFPRPQNSDKSTGYQYQKLKDWETQWECSKPMTFAAYRKREPSKDRSEVFPELWFVSELHSAAHQYYQLARILLTVYDPNLPRIGPGALSAQRKVSAEVRENVILLCGIAMSTINSQPAVLLAYNAIAMFGEHFTDRIEQDALLKLLDKLEREHGWPTAKTTKELKAAWSWVDT